jgi:peptide/nickel transport system ATP-binding protein
MSGGQLQRVSIARALLAKPKLLVADEPVSMIDASLRLRILEHLTMLKNKHHINIIYITHDLSTALQISDLVLIMYKGQVVERGDPESVILSPQHPYTKLLVESVPVPDPEVKWLGVSKQKEELLKSAEIS